MYVVLLSCWPIRRWCNWAIMIKQIHLDPGINYSGKRPPLKKGHLDTSYPYSSCSFLLYYAFNLLCTVGARIFDMKSFFVVFGAKIIVIYLFDFVQFFQRLPFYVGKKAKSRLVYEIMATGVLGVVPIGEEKGWSKRSQNWEGG